MRPHDGEVAVQRRAGITRSGLGSASVGVRLPDLARAFLRQQRMVVIGGRDGLGAVWASAMFGPAGFVRAEGEQTVIIDASPGPDDPLAGAPDGAEMGAIAVEPATQRRMRFNGRVRRDGPRLVITADQVFANCPKHIQPRTIVGVGPDQPASTRRTTCLEPAQVDAINRADTFFIATHALGYGADASHRGGNPGFVSVCGPTSLSWPEYRGNSMYMTLGNLALDPGCGLLFPDWTGGARLLQLSGRARVDWNPARIAGDPAAERMVDFEIDSIIEVRGTFPRWTTE